MDPEVEQLHSRAKSFAEKFRKGEGSSHIEEAINLGDEALGRCPPGHPQRAASLALLANHLCDRFGQRGVMSDLDASIVLDREALEHRPRGHPDRCRSLTNLAGRLCIRYNQLGMSGDLDDAIALDLEALDLVSGEHTYRPMLLNNLATHLSIRYDHLREIQDVNEAIALDREALGLCPQGHPARSLSLNSLADFLYMRHQRLGSMQDLDEAIGFRREALKPCPATQGYLHRPASVAEASELHTNEHPDRSMSLNNLAASLSARYKRLGQKQNLDEAIILNREALELRPVGHPSRTMSLTNLTLALCARYKMLGAKQDLDEATVLSRESHGLCPKGHPGRSMALNNLTCTLSARYKLLGEMRDLEEAVALSREALELWPQGHPNRSTSLINLTTYLITRYNQLGEMQNFVEAIALGREALNLFPQGHHDRYTPLINLAGHLVIRYEQLGSMHDLDEAIALGREALNLRPQGHPDRHSSLINLATCLSARFRQLEVIQDLNEAIVLNREALDLRPRGHPDRSMSLVNLAANLFARHRQLQGIEDLNEAILLDGEALYHCPKGQPDRAISLNNLSTRLSARYNHVGEIRDLDQAIALCRETLDLFPQGHHHRPTALNNLAIRLFERYKRLGTMQDLSDAIILGREALDFRPQGHPDRSLLLVNLARHLSDQFRVSKQLEDKGEAFNLYTQLRDVTDFVSSRDLTATREWISAAEEFQHPTLLLAYETSLQLLVHHLATLPSLPQHLVILKGLTSSLAVDAFSACLRNHSPTKAIEFLEQGRGVFWSQLSRLRSPLEDVIVSGPAGKVLADEFSRLAMLTRNALDSCGVNQHEQVHRLNLDMEKVVTKIRELPGLSRFLLPSLFSDLQCAAKKGPVIVVNASKYSCDALIILSDRDPVHVPLQITQGFVRDLATELNALTKRATKDDVTKQMAFFLRKLWDRIVGPIVDVLCETYPARSRIWWCPTAEFSQLPLHAAGPFRKGQKNLPELYISSYTPTLNALIRARQSDPSVSVTEQKRFLAIGQGNAVGESVLPSVGLELDTISQRISGLATFTRVEGEASCIAKVVEELRKTEWVHLSCHGLPNRTQPFESAFALRDGHFTIQRIIGCDLKNPEFAYLSACHTTVGDAESPDEVIHLASAVQFAGFRSVIGTMWAVDDGETSKITSTFYKYMVDGSGRLDHSRAAVALNKTMRAVNIPLDQRVLYIHLGA